MEKNKKSIIIFLISALFVLTAFFSILNKSRTIDELAHIVSGTYYLNTGSNYVFIEQPILQSIFSIPTIINKNLVVKFPPAHMNDNIYGENLEQVVFYARLINIFAVLLLSLFVTRLITKITKSYKMGLIFLVLMLFNPTTLAYSRFATPDVIGALTSFIAVLYLYIFLQTQTKKNVFILATFCTIAFLTKYTAVVPLIYISLSILIVTIKNWSKKSIINILIFGATILFLINSAFLFRGTADPLKNFEFVTSSTKSLVHNTFLGNIPSPLPREVIRGLDYVKWHTQEGHYNKPIYFMGKYYDHGTKFYFPTLYLIKTPGLILILFFISLLYTLKTFFKKQLHEKHKYILHVAIFPLFFYFFFVIFLNTLNLGVRHILFAYLTSYLIIAYGISNLSKQIFKYVIIILTLYLAIVHIQIYPHYLEYFNEFIGGPSNGYKYVVKDNLDWRQDANFIKDYKMKNSPNLIIDPQCGTSFSSGQVIAMRANKFFSMENGSLCYNDVHKGKLIDRVTYVWFIYEF
ncbi:MAG: glycosyltransferase family 39 protein [bacterium]|nr:glycosyltransferase family 39 protein [bacterium]